MIEKDDRPEIARALAKIAFYSGICPDTSSILKMPALNEMYSNPSKYGPLHDESMVAMIRMAIAQNRQQLVEALMHLCFCDDTSVFAMAVKLQKKEMAQILWKRGNCLCSYIDIVTAKTLWIDF